MNNMKVTTNLKEYKIGPPFDSKNQYSFQIKTYLNIKTVKVLRESLGNCVYNLGLRRLLTNPRNAEVIKKIDNIQFFKLLGHGTIIQINKQEISSVTAHRDYMRGLKL